MFRSLKRPAAAAGKRFNLSLVVLSEVSGFAETVARNRLHRKRRGQVRKSDRENGRKSPRSGLCRHSVGRARFMYPASFVSLATPNIRVSTPRILVFDESLNPAGNAFALGGRMLVGNRVSLRKNCFRTNDRLRKCHIPLHFRKPGARTGAVETLAKILSARSPSACARRHHRSAGAVSGTVHGPAVDHGFSRISDGRHAAHACRSQLGHLASRAPGIQKFIFLTKQRKVKTFKKNKKIQ